MEPETSQLNMQSCTYQYNSCVELHPKVDSPKISPNRASMPAVQGLIAPLILNQHKQKLILCAAVDGKPKENM